MNHTNKPEYGLTLFELIVAMGLFALLASIALSNLKDLDDPLQNGASLLLSFVKQARSQAISTTSAYTLSASTNSHIISAVSNKCSDATKIPDDNVQMELPSGVHMVDTSWTFCFTSRGLADSNIEIELVDADGISKTVEVLLGGAARVQ